MSTVDFTFRPIDTLYFGPPVSMPAGELNDGHSLFPPPPMTFQGIVRTRLLAGIALTHSLDDWSREAKAERERWIGGPDALPEGWQLAGPFPATMGDVIEPWFPTPRFALRAGDDAAKKGPVRAHRVESGHPVLHDLSEGDTRWDVGAPEVDAGEAIGGWVSARNLGWLLAETGTWDPSGFGSDLPPFVRREGRTGLAIDARRGTARDGMLYSLRALRMAVGSGFLGALRSPLDAAITHVLTSGAGTAGRGARPVDFGPARALHPAWTALRAGAHLPSGVDEEALFWLLAIAPAREVDVWSPLSVRLPDGVKCVVRAALIGAPQILGGLSMVGGNSRPNQAYVPAGSAWLIELRGGDRGARANALRELHDRPTVGQPADHPFGFGHTLVGPHSKT